MTGPAHPFRALVAYDLARTRAWLRLGAKDPLGLGLSLLLVAGAAGAMVAGAARIAPAVGHDPVTAAGLGVAAAILGLIIQASFGRGLAGGPMEPATLDRAGLAAWVALRAALAGAPAAVTLVILASAVDPVAGLTIAASGVLTLALAALMPDVSQVAATAGEVRDRPNRVAPALGLWSVALFPLRQGRRAPGLVLAVAWWVVSVRLATAHSGETYKAGLALACAVVTGLALRALDPDLLSALALTRQPLARLIALFAVGPVLAALTGGLGAALISGLPIEIAAAIGAAGALISGLWVVADALNLLAYGPNGVVRTWIYGAILAVLFQAIGPFALIAVAAGLYFMWRTAANRRWSAL